MLLREFNSACEAVQLRAALADCCAAGSWIDRMGAGRPYADRAALHAGSDAATAELDEDGLAQALAGHPRIGDRPDTAWSTQEQAGLADADAGVRARLADCNAEYERRFGHVYLVCAAGRTAEDLLDVCRRRLANDAATERSVVLGELAEINRIRLDKLIGGEG